MANIENEYGINELHMHGIKRQCFCPIGRSMCTYQIEITMKPRKWICDYLDVGSFIENMPEDQTLESACGMICDFMCDTYQPSGVMVKVKCDDARHMPVEVTKKVVRHFGRNNGVTYIPAAY